MTGMEWPVVSVFSGAMGLDLGLEQAGITPNLAIEVDPYCCLTIRTNRPKIDTWEEDIEKIDGKAIRKRLGNPKDVFLMVGGPPCQSFCPGGKRAALSDPRGNLIYKYLRLIKELGVASSLHEALVPPCEALCCLFLPKVVAERLLMSSHRSEKVKLDVLIASAMPATCEVLASFSYSQLRMTRGVWP